MFSTNLLNPINPHKYFVHILLRFKFNLNLKYLFKNPKTYKNKLINTAHLVKRNQKYLRKKNHVLNNMKIHKN